MNCAIYRSSRKQDTYLFVERKDDFSRLPESLVDMLGALQLVMELELDSDRRLAHSDAAEVMNSLASRGFYLQLPPTGGHPFDRPVA